MTDQNTGAPSASNAQDESVVTQKTAVGNSAPSRVAATHGSSVGAEKKRAVIGWVRIVAAVVLAAVAVFVWFDTAPGDSSFASERSSIEATDDLNNLRAEGAPQQEVVNGWTTIEYLSLLSEQQEQSNNRLDALLLLALLGGSVALATSRSNART